MTTPRLEPVRCACGWRGELASRTPCPACAEPYTSRLTKERIAMLRGIGAQQPDKRPVHIEPLMRIWLVRHLLIVAAGPPRPTSDGRRNAPPRRYRLTERGQIAVQEDDVRPAAECLGPAALATDDLARTA